jgi:nitrogen fixation NifU-like protein
MSDLRELYQEVIFDHNRNPRNYGVLAAPTRTAEGHNPLCGDNLKLYLTIKDDVVADLRFEGSGCAISTASASLMTEAVKGRPLAEVEKLFESFHTMLTEPEPTPHPEMGKLEVFEGVREFPARVKCATLAWHTLHNAVLGLADLAKTE